MNKSFEEVKSVLDTLPISYYLFRGIKMTMPMNDLMGCSFYDPINQSITISFDQISIALKLIPENSFSEKKAESIIRTMLYHEISHAILTPTDKNAVYLDLIGAGHRFPTINISDALNLINIMEDERIETKLHDYYMNTCFDELKYYVNKMTPSTKVDLAAITDPIQLFYAAVRFHQGKAKYVKTAEAIIQEHLDDITAATSTTDNNYIVYITEIFSLFMDIRNDNKINNDKDNGNNDKDNSKDDNKDNGNNDKDNKDEDDKDNKDEDDKDDDKDNKDEDDKDDNKDNEDDKDEDDKDDNKDNEDDKDNKDEDDKDKLNRSIREGLHNILNDIMNQLLREGEKQFNDPLFTGKIEQIIAHRNKIDKMNGQATQGYSGRIMPKTVIRNDYRWWVKQSTKGSIRKFAKKKINLFIDVSGSFYNNINKTNTIIYALKDIKHKNPAFDYDIVLTNTDTKILDKSQDYYIRDASGGNRITKNFVTCYKKVQSADSVCINLILFDGDMLSDSFLRKIDKNRFLGTVDHKNTIVITNPTNDQIVERLREAKYIISKNYMTELEENVLKSIDALYR